MSTVSNRAQAHQRIQEIYGQIATSRSGVSALESELQKLQNMKFDENGQIIESNQTLLKG
jgi:hypothetical protein